jgi:hypothetical protein
VSAESADSADSSESADDITEATEETSGSDSTDENLYHFLTKTLFGFYNKSHRPPEWVIEYVENVSLYRQDACKSRCYSMDDRTDAIRKVLGERQPVNIAMGLNLHYNPSGFQKAFGFGGYCSGYTELINEQGIGPTTRLPPNISVYCYTPMQHGTSYIGHQHVMNSIGVALDTKEQPDYKVLIKKSDEERLSEIKRVVHESYQCFLACAQDLNIDRIAICHLGGGAFSTEFSNLCEGNYIEMVWLPVVSKLLNEEGKFLKEIRLLSSKMNEDEESQENLKSLNVLLKKGICKVTHGGSIPGAANKESSDKVLFQNAWDPHSIAGNGNKADKSLDGFFGRSSAISVLTFPITNPFIALRLLSKPSLFPLSRLMSESLWISID